MNASSSRAHALRALALGLALALPAAAFAQTPSLRGSAPTQLAPVVTTATRTASSPHTIGSAVDSTSAAELARRQVSSLSGVLSGVANAPLVASGAKGGVTSLFLRGANSNQTLFLVDGVRLNDPNTDYAVFLGGSCVTACDSLEIAHGPQSTLYGGEAIGGVVSLRAQPGRGAPTTRVSAEAGSFGTVQGSLASQGERGATAWNFSALGGHTDNDRANNEFDSVTSALRLDHQLNATTKVGGTLRWFHGVYGDPGDRFTNDPDNEARESNVLTTAFATLTLAPAWTAHAMVGAQDRRFVSENPRPAGAAQITVVKNRRGVLDAQTTFSGWERHRVTGGVTAEANHTRNTGFGDINEKQTLLAAFVQDEYSPREDLFLTAGLRNDDFDTFGRATTGRGTVAWLVARRAVKLRASYGTAFRSPSFLDLYGRSAFYSGNPNLRPERARGWDGGVDVYLPRDRGTLSATWFDTRFRELIASTPDFRSVENIQRARTRGLELSARLVLAGTDVNASYTLLDAQNVSASTRLLRRPRHRASADVWREIGRGFGLGGGLVWVAQREDVHARTFRRIDGEDYTVARFYASYAVSPACMVRVRVENAFDDRYEEVHGYPALGRGVFAGVEWTF